MTKARKLDYKVGLLALLYVSVFAACGWLGCYFYADYMAQTAKHEQEAQSASIQLSYVDMPRISVQLGSGDHTLRMDVALEVEKKDAKKVEGFRPRITDRMISYMEKQDTVDFNRPQSMLRLKSGLLEEARNAGAPQIRDIVFKQFTFL